MFQAVRLKRPDLGVLVQGALDLFDGEALDVVAFLDVLEALELHAALLARRHLVDLVLEAFERVEHAQLQNHHVVADDADARALADHAFGDAAARDPADLGDVEGLQNLGVAQEGFALERRHHAREHALNVVQQVEDDRVVADLDAFTFGQIGRLLRGPDVEAQDRRPGRLGQGDVGLGDAAGARLDGAGADLAVADLVQRADDGFGGVLNVGLDEDRQYRDLFGLQIGHHVDQRQRTARDLRLLALHALTVFGQFASAGLGLHHSEDFARR